MTLYKVRDPKTGLYQLGGKSVRWSKTGKRWNTGGHVKAHFTCMREHASVEAHDTGKRFRDPIDPNWLIEEFVVKSTSLGTRTVAEFLKVK